MCYLYLKLKLKIKGIFGRKVQPKSVLKGVVFFIYCIDKVQSLTLFFAHV